MCVELCTHAVFCLIWCSVCANAFLCYFRFGTKTLIVKQNLSAIPKTTFCTKKNHSNQIK